MKTPRCCTICKNHGQKVSITSHVCPFTDCRCSLCQLTRLSRRVMCHQQRLWRHKKLDGKGSSTPDDATETAAHTPEAGQAEAATEVKATKQKRTKRDVVCDRCRNHNLWVQKRGHKGQCPFEACECSYCAFTGRRQRLMKHQQRVRRAMVTPGPHDTSEMAQLSQDVLELPSHPPTSEHVSSALPLSSTAPFSPSISCSVSSPSSTSLCSPISSTSSGPHSSSISPSFSPSYSSIPCTSYPPASPISSSYHQGHTVDGESHSHYTATPSKLALQDSREMVGDEVAQTRSLPPPRPAVRTNTTFLPLPHATTPPLPLTTFAQGKQDTSNALDPKERLEYLSTPHSRAHLVAQELEALHMREEREMLPARSLPFASASHRVLRPHPISRSWLPHHTLYPEWTTYSAHCHPPPPPPPPHPPPPPPHLPSPYSFHAISDDREVTAQTHVPSWYPGAWCLRCCLQEAYVHTRSYSGAVTHSDRLPGLPSTNTTLTPFPTAPNKESVFCGSRFVFDTRASETFTSYK